MLLSDRIWATRKVPMYKKSFFNPFAVLLLALAALAFVVDVLLQAKGDVDAFTPAVLSAMWVVGGFVRLFYEKDAKRSFDGHMREASHASAWKMVEGCWRQVEAVDLRPGDEIRVSAGMLCPVHAVLSEGSALVSESSLTGESGLVEKCEGDEIRAGVVIASGQAIATVVTGAGERGRGVRFGRRRAEYAEGAKSVCLAFAKCMLVTVPFVIFVRGAVLGDWPHALLFALGTTVGLVPEMLPVVNGACLSGGARRLEAKRVIVKNVDAMESLGSMDVVCVDKTGTLTDDTAVLEYYVDVLGNESAKTLGLAYLECAMQGSQTSQLDKAVVSACDSPEFAFPAKGLARACRLDEADPFDHVSKASGVKLDVTPEVLDALGLRSLPGEGLAIVKGEVESVCSGCRWVDVKGEVVPMTPDGAKAVFDAAEEMRSDGIKVLAVAYAPGTAGRDGLALCGLLGFFDAPKKSAKSAIAALSALSVEVRVLTGDSSSVAKSVCSRLGIPSDDVVTGAMLAEMTESEALFRVAKAHVFAELDPLQKAEIVNLLRAAGHSVGYIGDGVNDVPALVSADVGIVVDSAAVESKEAADMVLLERDLGVVAEGVGEGRRAFANASKYVRIASSSNFGNIVSLAAASAFLPFLPATASQLLVLNLSYDAVCLAMPWDNVDEEEVRTPKTWTGKGLGRFMGYFGLASAVFDVVTFSILYFAVCPALCGGAFPALDSEGRALFVALFQAGWLLESVWTQSSAVLALRTRRALDRDRKACLPLVLAVAFMLAASAALLLTPAASAIGLAPMPAWYLGIVAAVCALYLALASALKRVYLARAENLF